MSLMRFPVDSVRHLPAEEKIRRFEEMPAIIGQLASSGMTVVLAQGVFDIVHLGHVGYLRAARAIDPENNVLVVGVENDEAVRRNKGDKRPINTVDERLQLLAEFMSTALVFSYDDAPDYGEPSQYIERYRTLGPVAIVVPTWDPHRELKEWQAHEAGTQLALVDYQHMNSTSLMLRKVGYTG